MSEFALISRLKQRFSRVYHPEWVQLGIGDDAALCSVSGSLAISTDVLVSGVHFSADARPEDVGYKALAVNLSDLAAMGASPRAALLAWTLPALNDAWNDWAEAFLDGFGELSCEERVDLIGGDLSRGPSSIAVTILGHVSADQAFKRSQAKVGDRIWVSGLLGQAAWAFYEPGSASQIAQKRLHRPQPRIQLGQALRGHVRCAMDISDGLFADLGHILTASGMGARLDWASIPTPADCPLPKAQLLRFGDDYELLWTAPPDFDAQTISQQTGLQLTCIGEIVLQSGITLLDPDQPSGVREIADQTGWSHF